MIRHNNHRRTRCTTFGRAAKVIVLATLLTSCSASLTDPERNASVHPTYQAVVSDKNIGQELDFSQNNQLSKMSERSIANFLKQIQIRYGDKLYLVDYSASGTAQRWASLSRFLKRYGLSLMQSPYPLKNIGVPGTSKLMVVRSDVAAQECVYPSDSIKAQFNGYTFSSFGCAVRSNMAHQVADPSDLVSGKHYSGPDGGVISRAIQKTMSDNRQ